MRKIILTAAALGLAAGPLLAVSPALAAGNDTVTIKSFAYATPVSVAPGATVTVVNNDPEAHTVTADSGGAFDDLATAGSTTSFKAPSQPGQYPFHCNFHSNMHGVLVVTAASSSSGGAQSSGGSATQAPASPSTSAKASDGSTSQMQAVPSGGVATGGGSTSGLEDEALVAGGAAAVAAGLGVLAVGVRRRGAGSKA